MMEDSVSIYRKFDPMRLPSSDVYARAGPSLEPLWSPVTSVPDGDQTYLRKASPANMPLPRTLAWIATLPLSVKPAALLRHYPRIANVLAAAWGDQTAVSSYMDCLLRDRRGNRKGFPDDVHVELLALRELHTELYAKNPSNWEILRKRG